MIKQTIVHNIVIVAIIAISASQHIVCTYQTKKTCYTVENWHNLMQSNRIHTHQRPNSYYQLPFGGHYKLIELKLPHTAQTVGNSHAHLIRGQKILLLEYKPLFSAQQTCTEQSKKVSLLQQQKITNIKQKLSLFQILLRKIPREKISNNSALLQDTAAFCNEMKALLTKVQQKTSVLNQ